MNSCGSRCSTSRSGGSATRSRPVHRGPHLLPRNLAHPAAHRNSAARVHPAHMRPSDTDHRRLDRAPRHALRRQRRLVDRLCRRSKLRDQSLAHPARGLDAVPPIPQNAILQLRHQHAALRAPRIHHRNQTVLLGIHRAAPTPVSPAGVLPEIFAPPELTAYAVVR